LCARFNKNVKPASTPGPNVTERLLNTALLCDRNIGALRRLLGRRFGMVKAKRTTLAFFALLGAISALVPATAAAPGPGSSQCTGGPPYNNPHCPQHH
jgi:hypothetical protein